MGSRSKKLVEYKINDVLACVVTYNPNIKRLKECLIPIVDQVQNLYIFDNGSSNFSEVKNLSRQIVKCNITVINNRRNEGIATALKKAMEWAKDHEFSWILTLDQDSVLQKNTVKEYLKAANDKKNRDTAIFTSLIRDRNFRDQKYEVQDKNVMEVPYCITSGSFTNVDLYFHTAGYDEKFFIDCVDFDICYTFRERGYKINRINHLGVLHEVGHGEQRRFLWKKIIVYHEKPLRVYYFARNTYWLYKKHDSYSKLRLIKKYCASICRIIFYETEKHKKIDSFIKGIRDAKRA